MPSFTPNTPPMTFDEFVARERQNDHRIYPNVYEEQRRRILDAHSHNIISTREATLLMNDVDAEQRLEASRTASSTVSISSANRFIPNIFLETASSDPEPTRTKKDNYRALLKPDMCPFCAKKTDIIHECENCKFKCFSSCGECRRMGAPKIHAPRRMILMRGKEYNSLLCYPQCARKLAYLCRECHHWYDKDSIEGLIRQEGNISHCLCKGCAIKHNETICAMCHAIVQRREELCDKAGSRCESCFGRVKYTCKKQNTVVVKANKKDPRTFGFELEINYVHRSEELSEKVAALNVDGVKFSVVGDGSVHHGFEIISTPCDYQLLMRGADAVFKLVRQYKHNYRGCGLHVHVADQKTDPISAVMWWIMYEDFIFSILPPHRCSNSYCRPIHRVVSVDEGMYRRLNAAKSVEDLFTIHTNRGSGMESKYLSLNMLALAKHGTLEARCMHATTELDYFGCFMEVMNAIWNFASHGKPSAKNWDETTNLCALVYKPAKASEKLFMKVCQELKLSPLTSKYLLDKRNFFLKGRYNADTLGLPPEFERDNAPERTQTPAATLLSALDNAITYSNASRVLRYSRPTVAEDTIF